MEITKNTNVTFEKKLSSYKQKPQEGTCFIIKKNLKQLVPKILKDINEFTNTNAIKNKALCQLQHTIVIAESSIQPFLEDIIKTISKHITYEDEITIQKLCIVVAEILGIYVDADIYVPVMITLFQDEESKSNQKFLSNLMMVFSLMLQNETAETIESQLEKIVQCINSFEQTHEDNEEVLYSLFLIDKQLINIGGESLAIYCRQLFTILLNLQATTKFGRQNFDFIDEIMLKLSKLCGYTSVSDLHANEVSILLEEFTKNKSYMEWNKFSRDRLKFDVIVRNCKEGISKFMPTILEIIQHNSNRDAEVEIKIDMLVLIEFLLSQEKLAETLRQHSVQLLQQVLIPSMQWKIGKSQTRTRKAGVINVIKMIDNDLITPEGLLNCLKQILPPIKNCLDDDWTPDLRYAACNLCERIFKLVREIIGYEDIFQFYTALLERLDDAQDAVRMEITKTLIIFFSFPCLQSSPTIADYCIKALFIHLDDQNEEIQNSMFNCLKFAARFFPNLVIAEGQNVQGKMKYPRRCTEIINLCQELKSESNNDQIQEEK